MSKRKFKKGARSITKAIHVHTHTKLKSAMLEGNTELARYYEKEIRRLEEQLAEKERKLLPRKRRIKS